MEMALSDFVRGFQLTRAEWSIVLKDAFSEDLFIYATFSVDAHLQVDVLKMLGGCLSADEKPFGDLPDAEPVAQQEGHFLLSRGKPGRVERALETAKARDVRRDDCRAEVVDMGVEGGQRQQVFFRETTFSAAIENQYHTE